MLFAPLMAWASAGGLNPGRVWSALNARLRYNPCDGTRHLRRLSLQGLLRVSQATKLGPTARRFLVTMAGADRRLFRAEDAAKFWSSKKTASDALSRLVDDGWLERIERGLYLIVPLEAGPGRQWTEEPQGIASQLAPQGAVAYWTALHHWGMTEQVPRTMVG